MSKAGLAMVFGLSSAGYDSHGSLRSHLPHRVAALLLACAAFTLSVSSGPAANGADRSSAANVILIVADDLGWGEVGCYGQRKIRTPNIDRLAEQGMRFTRAYSGAPVCAPSRCVLMTGLELARAPIRGNKEMGEEGQIPAARQVHHLGHASGEERRLRHLRHRQVGAGHAQQRGQPVGSRALPFLRLSVPAQGAQLLSRVPLERRPQGAAGQRARGRSVAWPRPRFRRLPGQGLCAGPHDGRG